MPINSLYNESELIRRITAGDASAFGQLYNSYRLSVYHLIVKFIKLPAMAEDLTQEVFIKIWETRGRLAEINSIKDYLFITARNHTLNRLKQIARQDIAMGEIIRHYPSRQEDAGDKLLQQEYWQHIQRVLDSLPERTREIFQLCRIQEKTYDEVADLLGITRDAVKKHMVRSNKAFKDSLGDLDISMAVVISLILLP